MNRVTVVGAGLAGSEAAWQLAAAGVHVRLFEMRPGIPTQAHHTGDFAEIVCSNSLGSDESGTAPALLKAELRALGSHLLKIADETRVPAGKALAVDRNLFRQRVTETLTAHPLIDVIREEIVEVPEPPAIIASGPLTSDRLAERLQALTGKANLYFHDASSPIVLAETIDQTRVFRASRYGRGNDYLNSPLDREQYRRFRDELLTAERAQVHELDKINYFEGCLPIEELAVRGEDTMRFGPMKPVGLVDPATGKQPYAVVQLRQDDLAAEHFNIVGFQSRLKWGEQKRVFGMLPGLEQAEFVRFGRVHRNTYLNAPAIITPGFEWRVRPGLFIAGTLIGVEGYTECVASGLIGARAMIARLSGREFQPPPPTTALGALTRYMAAADWRNFQPVNFSFGLLDPLQQHVRGRAARREALVHRSRLHFDEWAASMKAAS